MRVDRLLAIIMILINKDCVKAKELADYLEVSTRTIYRDLDAINQAGIPIVSHQGKDGGFSIIESYKIKQNFFTYDEMESIVTSLTGISKTMYDNRVFNVLQKINSIIPQEDLRSINERNKQILIDLNPWGFSKNQKHKLKQIQKCIQENKCITFKYTNNKGVYSLRFIEPMTIIFRGIGWYVYGFCRDKQDFRTFKVSRIRELEVQNEKFTAREKQDLKKYIVNCNTEKTENEKIVLKFSSYVRAFVEDQFNEEQIKDYSNESIIVEIDYPEDNWLYGLILSFGEYVEVISPAHLRDIIKGKAEKILNIYI